MLNRLRQLFESIVYAGISSRGKAAPPAGQSALRTAWDRYFVQPSDPLYLTNRTFFQRAQRAVIFAIPVVTAIAGAMLGLHYWGPTAPTKELTPEEVAKRVLPHFNNEIKVNSNKELELTEVHFEHAGGSLILGTLWNQSNHVVAEAVLIFDLADESGSQLGATTVRETNLAPGESRKFRRHIEQTTAEHAVVREIRTR